MARIMLRRSMFLFCLLMTSLIASTMVHARELPTTAALECSGEMHADRDSEQSSDVSDQDVPHNHGGCAGHCLFTPVSGTSHDLSCGVPAKFCFARSEEHTSELQSLMRISYAVFCLKKKKQINTEQHIQ